ncbi:MAG: ABC transporter permease [Marinilabiliales bacterium]
MKILKHILEALIIAYKSLVVNKLRTFLSLLGVTIGIFAIISVFTVIDSMERSIRNSIASLGDNVVYVQKWPWEFGPDYAWWKYMNRPVPNIKERNIIKKKSKYAEAVSFMVSTMQTAKYKGNFAENIAVIASDHEYNKIRSFEIEKGRYFSTFETEHGNAKAIIGPELASGLFGDENPLGKTIKIGDFKVNIIGVFKKEGNDMFNSSMDNAILIPVNYVRNIVDIRSEFLNPLIMVKAKDGIDLQILIDELRGIMRSYRRLKPMEEDDFALNRASLITQGFSQIFISIDIVGLIIGGFSILVGGFGIANIMFVSVKERTKQIGIQKALGAKNYFILIQFLFESIMLCLIGGLIGLLLVFTGSVIANSLIEIDMKFTMSAGNIISGILISVIIGIISGWAPARSAGKLNPVEAINSTF